MKRTYRDAIRRQQAERDRAALTKLQTDFAAGRELPQPSRITMALDLCGLYGPDVDRACGAEEPAVDQWEAGQAAPSWEQLVALADLTGFTVEFFFRELEVTAAGQITVCRRSGPGRGCETIVMPAPVAPYAPSADVVSLFGQRVLL